VHDASGQPVAGAQVIVAETGDATRSAADGSFCFESSVAGRTVVVLAVGFQPQRLSLLDARPNPLAVTLRTISVLNGALALRSDAPAARGGEAKDGAVAAPGAASPAPAAAPGFAAAPPAGAASKSVLLDEAGKVGVARMAPRESVVTRAELIAALEQTANRLEADAANTQSASEYDAAAAEWDIVLGYVAGGAAESDTRFRVARARYYASQLGPSNARVDAANAAVRAYLEHAPQGEQRDAAAGWLGRVSSWDRVRATYR
jgi:hypothetical protein